MAGTSGDRDNYNNVFYFVLLFERGHDFGYRICALEGRVKDLGMFGFTGGDRMASNVKVVI